MKFKLETIKHDWEPKILEETDVKYYSYRDSVFKKGMYELLAGSDGLTVPQIRKLTGQTRNNIYNLFQRIRNDGVQICRVRTEPGADFKYFIKTGE